MIRLEYVQNFRGGHHECLVAFLVPHPNASYAVDYEPILNYQDDQPCLRSFAAKWRVHAAALKLPLEWGEGVSELF